jgi:hypothetical protein
VWWRSGINNFTFFKFKEGVSNDQEGYDCVFMELNPRQRGGWNGRPDAFGWM